MYVLQLLILLGLPYLDYTVCALPPPHHLNYNLFSVHKIKISITAIMAVVSESKCSSQTPEKHLSATKAQHGHQPLHKSRVFPTINIMVGHGDK